MSVFLPNNEPIRDAWSFFSETKDTVILFGKEKNWNSKILVLKVYI